MRLQLKQKWPGKKRVVLCIFCVFLLAYVAYSIVFWRSFTDSNTSKSIEDRAGIAAFIESDNETVTIDELVAHIENTSTLSYCAAPVVLTWQSSVFPALKDTIADCEISVRPTVILRHQFEVAVQYLRAQHDISLILDKVGGDGVESLTPIELGERWKTARDALKEYNAPDVARSVYEAVLKACDEVYVAATSLRLADAEKKIDAYKAAELQLTQANEALLEAKSLDDTTYQQVIEALKAALTKEN